MLTRLASSLLVCGSMIASAQVTVVAGSYGENCGAPRGNKTGHLAEFCNGARRCAYRIDHQVIGDPVIGCGKNYLAEWRCEASGKIFRAAAAPEAGFGSVLTLSCPPELQQAPVLPLQAGGEGITVIQVTGGSRCGFSGAQTAPLAKACNGRTRCDFEFGPEVDATCLNDLSARWHCGREARSSLVLVPPGAKTLTLSCEAPRPAPPPPPEGVQIVSATYGGNCGAPAGNVSAVVAASCNGKAACPYVVDWQRLGDPAWGCGKDFVVAWRCSFSAKVATVRVPGEAGFKKTALVSCQ
ncbi:MAG: hypothetical protein Q8L48_14590 [Archangium sp.]|nr:hypothetical protein [Archangium sp.]